MSGLPTGRSPDMVEQDSHPSKDVAFVTAYPLGGDCEHAEHVGDHVPPIYQNITRVPSGGLRKTSFGDDLYAGLSAAVPGMKALASETKAATHSEKRMTLLQGLRLYPKAMGWSTLLSLTIVLEGVGLSINNTLLAFPQFKEAYGSYVDNHGYQISTYWQSLLTNGPVIGEILGLLANGFMTDRLGYRKTMMISLLFLCLSVFLAFFSSSIQMLLVSQILCGLPWGVFQTLSTTYAAEVMPVALRAYLTSNVNLCWLVGQIIGVSCLRSLLLVESHWSYRISFGLQWALAVPILALMLFAPESPWLLVRQERYEEAKKVLKRLTRKQVDINLGETLSMMLYTNEVEKHFGSGVSYFDCFRGTDLRRTEISCLVWMIQSLCGSAMTGWAAYFFQQAGLPNARSFDLTLGMYGLAIIGQMLSWYSMRHCGRRTLYICGCCLCFIALAVTGVIGTRPLTPSISWTLGSMLVIFTFIYDSTIGPVCYSLVAEIPSTRLRIKTVILARIAYNIVSLAAGFLTAKMLNPTGWDWGAKSCFLWMGTCFLCGIWSYLRLPEPKGLTYMELDILFEKKAPARSFHKVQVRLAESGYFSLTGIELRSVN